MLRCRIGFASSIEILAWGSFVAFTLVPMVEKEYSYSVVAIGVSLLAASGVAGVLSADLKFRTKHDTMAGMIIFILIIPVLVSSILAGSQRGLISGCAFTAFQLAMASLGRAITFDRIRSVGSLISVTFATAIIATLIAYGPTLESTRFNILAGVTVHPNYVALVALCMALCSTVLSLKVLVFLHALSLGMSAYCQSRSVFICISESLGIAFVTLIFPAIHRRTRKGEMAIFLGVGAIVLLLLFACINFDHLDTSLLLISDEYRGIDSGFSGRDVSWRELLEIWKQSPAFGQGYADVREKLGVPTDGGYFLVGAETGIFGLGAVLVVFGIYFFQILGNWKKSTIAFNALSASTLVTFITLNIVESRIQSYANPFAFLFYLTLYASVYTPRMPATRLS